MCANYCIRFPGIHLNMCDFNFIIILPIQNLTVTIKHNSFITTSYNNYMNCTVNSTFY